MPVSWVEGKGSEEGFLMRAVGLGRAWCGLGGSMRMLVERRSEGAG